jgi:hypothetical protein
MRGIGSDPAARSALIAALVTAGALAATRVWVEAADAPESWWRLRWSFGVAGSALLVATVCGLLAWRRRASSALALPLAAAAAILLASAAAAL